MKTCFLKHRVDIYKKIDALILSKPQLQINAILGRWLPDCVYNLLDNDTPIRETYYWVSFKGFTQTFNRWESESVLKKFGDLIEIFNENYPVEMYPKCFKVADTKKKRVISYDEDCEYESDEPLDDDEEKAYGFSKRQRRKNSMEYKKN